MWSITQQLNFASKVEESKVVSENYDWNWVERNNRVAWNRMTYGFEAMKTLDKTTFKKFKAQA